MWSDNETTLDLLNIRHLTSATESIVCNQDLLPATIGVFGGWGSGKSSLIGMVREDLERVEGTLCISFNGWLFEGYEDAKSALMGTIVDEIVACQKPAGKAKELADKLRERVDWFRLMGLVGSSALSLTVGLPPVAGIDSVLKESPDDSVRDTVRKFHEDFASLLAETNIKTLVVFIDDLDRCLPDTVIATLEAIRLFVFVPHTAFILGADEELVKHAVKRRFPETEGSSLDVGRDYLEKLVQFPIRIPPLGRAEIETYMNLLFTQLHTDDEPFRVACADLLDRPPDAISGVGFDLDKAGELLGSLPEGLVEDLSLAEQTADILASGLSGNPRQTKRFLNTLILRQDMAKARSVELRRRVLAKLMLLEYFRTESFRELASWQAKQEGKPAELELLERRLRRVDSSTATHREEGGEAGDMRSDAGSLAEDSDPESAQSGFQQDIEGPAKQWLENDWLVHWVSLEPVLAGIDLRPYFFFAREEIGALSGPSRRMSPEARTVLSRLASSSEADRRAGSSQVEELSEADASAVFQSIAELIRRTEDLGAEDSPLDALYRFSGARKEFVGEAIKLLGALPEANLTVRIPPRLMGMARDTSAEPEANEVLRRWSKSTSNSHLASASSNVLQSQVTGGSS